MAITEFRVYFNNTAATAEQLALIDEIRVDQAIDMVTEAQITVPLGSGASGDWPGVLDETIQPLSRVRVEVLVGDGEFVALIDGLVIAQRFELGGGPNESQGVIVINDDTAMMNRSDRARLFEDMSPEDIARQVFAEYSIDAETDNSGVGSPSLERVVTQRGTDFGLLRRLAREANRVVYVEPGDSPGTTKGFFRQIPTTDTELPELVLIGKERNLNNLTLELDVLSPVEASSQGIDPATLDNLTTDINDSDIAPLGETPTADFTEPGKVFAQSSSDQTQLDASSQATVDRGAWAYSGHGEVSAEIYPAVMRPYRVVAVAGAGTLLSGHYLISEVNHSLRDEAYTQRFTLRRNAASDTSTSGIPGGIF